VATAGIITMTTGAKPEHDAKVNGHWKSPDPVVAAEQARYDALGEGPDCGEKLECWDRQIADAKRVSAAVAAWPPSPRFAKSRAAFVADYAIYAEFMESMLRMRADGVLTLDEWEQNFEVTKRWIAGAHRHIEADHAAGLSSLDEYSDAIDRIVEYEDIIAAGNRSVNDPDFRAGFPKPAPMLPNQD
jgi:hypothetical protein